MRLCYAAVANCRKKVKRVKVKIDIPINKYESLQLFVFLFFSLIFTGRNEAMAKVMFLLVCVILFTGGSASVHAGIPPHAQKQTPLRSRPPQKQTPLPPESREPPLGSIHTHPPRSRPPWETDTPRKQTPSPGTRSMSGRYASYWNAFLFTWRTLTEIYKSKILQF